MESYGYYMDYSPDFSWKLTFQPNELKVTKKRQGGVKKAQAVQLSKSSGAEASSSEPQSGEDSSEVPSNSEPESSAAASGSEDQSQSEDATGEDNASGSSGDSSAAESSHEEATTTEAESSTDAEESSSVAVSNSTENDESAGDASEQEATDAESSENQNDSDTQHSGKQESMGVDNSSNVESSGVEATTSEEATGAESEDNVGYAKNNENSSGWSQSLDALLVSMKEGKETWASIAQTLNKSKKDVKARYKELEASDTSQPPTEAEAAVKKAPKGKDQNNTKGKTAGKEENKPGNPKANGSAKGKAKVAETKRASDKETAKETSENLFAVQGKRKGNKRWDPESSNDAGSERSMVEIPPPRHPHRHPDDDEDSEIAQQDYLQTQIRESLYPAYLSYKPDDYFTGRDCRILATIDSKMKRSRWLEMQANFCNVTGMMVPIEMLKRKTDEAEAATRKKEGNARARSWIDGLPDDQMDPNEQRAYVEIDEDG